MDIVHVDSVLTPRWLRVPRPDFFLNELIALNPRIRVELAQMKDKNLDPITALDVLQKLLEKDSPLAADFKRYKLKLDWASIVGPTIAEKCSPVAYSKGVLFIWVANSTWLNQLFYARQEILKKINLYVGEKWAKDIRFTQDKKDIPAEGKLT